MNVNVSVKIGMADLNVTSELSSSLKTTGLGSCVGITLYDPYLKISGMAHVMLPESSIAGAGQLNKAKYADTAIPELLAQMVKLGASPFRIVAKMAGGSQMFAFVGKQEALRIGQRNIESSRQILMKLNIPLKAEDTGGNFGRTIEMYNETGILVVRSVQRGVKQL